MPDDRYVPEEQLDRQALAELPVATPGRMSVPSHTEDFPVSPNIEDRRQPSALQSIRDATNDVYLGARALLGLGRQPLKYLDVKNPDERLGTAQDIRDRIGVIRERHGQAKEAYDAAHTKYQADVAAYKERRDAYFDASSKYHDDLDTYMAGVQKAAAAGRLARFTRSNPPPVPPADKTGRAPQPDDYFGDLTKLRIYDKLNPE